MRIHEYDVPAGEYGVACVWPERLQHYQQQGRHLLIYIDIYVYILTYVYLYLHTYIHRHRGLTLTLTCWRELLRMHLAKVIVALPTAKRQRALPYI